MTDTWTPLDPFAALADLWSAETCGIDWRYEPAHYAAVDAPWTLSLTWVDDHHAPHGADFAEYHWQFTGATPAEAAIEAVAWCRALLPFKRCDECDGAGSYGLLGQRRTCEGCAGTGLANRPAGS